MTASTPSREKEIRLLIEDGYDLSNETANDFLALLDSERATSAALRGALEPFAKAMEITRDEIGRQLKDHVVIGAGITVGDLHRARSALRAGKE